MRPFGDLKDSSARKCLNTYVCKMHIAVTIKEYLQNLFCYAEPSLESV